jgi:hypothetical protein
LLLFLIARLGQRLQANGIADDQDALRIIEHAERPPPQFAFSLESREQQAGIEVGALRHR